MSQSYRQLRLDEREAIFRMKDARLPVSRIAERLGRHPSTIYRELRRNFFFDEDSYFRGYFPSVAHKLASDRRVPGRKLARNPELASYVIDGLHRCWSPEQIAGRLRFACQNDLRVSHETIYQYVYGMEGKRQELYRLLPWSRRRRRPRRGRKPRGLQIPLANGIDQRPADIAERETFGHWEGDLVQFRKVYGKANLTSLVERKSRYAVLWRNPSRSSAGVMAGIDRQLAPLPPVLRRTVTFDRGTEFAAYPTLHRKLGINSYFCEPRAPWQKGGVENFNGRLRRFLPSDTDIAALDEAAIEAISNRINRTPRKCLGYRTPEEVLMDQIAMHTASSSSPPGVGLAPPQVKC
jgi:IS30 family transposase